VGVPDADGVRAMVSAAVRAPSVHNSQPWRWEYDGHQLHLSADWSRQLRHGDPDGRDLIISCGAALHHVCVAASALGWRATPHRLPPGAPQRLATIDFSESAPSAVTGAALQAIHQRQTDRRTPTSTPVPRRQLDALVRTATIHGAIATQLPDEASEPLRDMMLLASVIQHSSDAYLEELAQWTHSRGDDGVPDSSVTFRPNITEPSGAGTRFPSGFLLDHEPTNKPASQCWILLTTSSDDVRSRLRAGEALSAILLLAQLQGLAVVPYTQPIEVDAARSGIERALLRGSANLQVILRVAVAPPGSPALRRTRRRPLDEVLHIAGEHQEASAPVLVAE
jgi:nitroreductase